ncbi:uncharacterized protein LOC135170228 [Diachasmimorpha longicaudata]|uniref:uncharacterized protein LOC135170228 n=1 Tax=Diachasmimorpha longicaudata TaxID=58733 RepID=UPI0030B88362
MLLLVLFISGLFPLQVEPVIPLPSFSDMRALFLFATEMFSKLNDFHEIYEKFESSASLNDIMFEVNEVSQRVTELGNKLERKLDTIVQTLLQQLPLANEISADLRELHRGVTTVDTLFEDFNVYTSPNKTFNNATILSFAQSITKYGTSNNLNNVMNQMHSLIVPTRGSALKESLILLLGKEVQLTFFDACDQDWPPQQRLYEIYTIIITTEIEAYMMISFAYTYRSTFEEGEFMAEAELSKEKFERRVEQYMLIFRQALLWSPRGFRRCDPQVHKRGETFYEFERFVNTYVVTEEALNSEQSCKGTCGSQPNPTSLYTKCEGFECDFTAQRCEGKIINCRSGENKMEICLAPPVPRLIWNPRRYEWFRDGSGVLYGNNQAGCQPGRQKRAEWYWKHKVYSCDICICTCVDDHPWSVAHHFVSLREVVADIDQNMVVTGLKFISTERVIQVQIQQGKLEREGNIQSGSETWKRSENLGWDSQKSYNRKTFIFERNWRQADDTDFAVFNFNNRTINLDHLEAPINHLITGVKFSRVEGGGDNTYPIQLEIRVTPFDYTNGTLINIEDSYWINPSSMNGLINEYDEPRTKIDQPDYLMSPLGVQLTKPEFKSNKWIQLERTGDRVDAGQTVIPLLDGLPVTMQQPLPLSGINFFHKTAERYGGFLSFQTLMINRTEYMKFDTAPEV